MSGAGAVGGSGGGGGGGGAGAAGAAGAGAGAVTPAAGASDSGDFSGGGGDAAKSVGDDGGSSNTGAHVHPTGCNHGQMNTQNFVQIHNHSVQQVNNIDECNQDFKKLIEMMMAIKLLQEMNKS